jgi:hypothetical protein
LKLLADKGEVVEIMEHGYSFYHKLMGLEGETRVFSLATNLWQNDKLISREENFYLE